jgi:pyruvate dehydrogenase E2 component (dihydrolipoamide acetyltransferase)
MPRLSDSMEEGTIVRWLKQDGDSVVQGEPLAEVETDKATVTFEADADGTLHILGREGATVQIGQPIAAIGEVGQPAAREPRANGRAKASPLARPTESAGGRSLRPSCRAPRSRCRTWGCTAWPASPRSSTRRKPPSSR